MAAARIVAAQQGIDPMRSLMQASVAVVLAMAAGGAAFALEGGYDSPMGTKAEFRVGGVLHVMLPTGDEFDEHYAYDGETLTISSAEDSTNGCPGTMGVYLVMETAEGASFTMLSDDCAIRIDDLTSGVWTKADMADDE